MALVGGSGAAAAEAQQQQQQQQSAATPVARESAAAAAEAQLQQQLQYLSQQQQQPYSPPSIIHGYPGMMQAGSPVDPTQAQMAAFANQTAMYGPYGSPYALNMPPPPTGGPYFSGAPPQFYPGVESFSLPGPAYYDPYGMINPAACVAPLPTPETPDAEPTKHPRRKSKRWFGCC
ncbi:hypothetical protein Efla_002469 [Eimeria flavescens]